MQGYSMQTGKFFTIRRSLLFMVILSAILLLLSFFRIVVHGDEGIIAEHSYWFNKLGYVKSEMFQGMNTGWEIRQYHFHKLFVFTGAFFIRLFGVSLFALRSISLLFLILAIGFIFKYSKENSNQQPYLPGFFLSVILLFANYNLVESGVIFRPETMLMALGFVSFYFIDKGLKESGYSYVIIAAVIAGLGVYTHLNGVCFVFAGFGVLALNKKYGAAFLFGTVSSIVSLLYFADIASVDELIAFWQQFTNDPNLTNSDLLNPFIKLVNEQSRFFWNPTMSLFTILTIISLILNFKMLKKVHGSLLLYLLLLVVGLAIFSHGKTLKYGLVYFPFMALITGLSLPGIVKFSGIKKYTVAIVFAAFFIANTASLIANILHSTNRVKRNELKSMFMPVKQVNILGNENFFFNQIENYSIHIRLAFSLLYEKYYKRTPTKEDFFDFARQGDNRYIIADKLEDTDEFLKLIEFETIREGDVMYNYRVIRKSDDFVIFEKE